MGCVGGRVGRRRIIVAENGDIIEAGSARNRKRRLARFAFERHVRRSWRRIVLTLGISNLSLVEVDLVLHRVSVRGDAGRSGKFK